MHLETPLVPAEIRRPWQRIAAIVIFGAALLVLGYGFVLRPLLSRAVGEQVAAEIRTQLDDQFAAQLTGAAPEAPALPASVGDSGGVVGQSSGESSDSGLPPITVDAVVAPSMVPGSVAEQGAQAATALAVSLGQAPATTGNATGPNNAVAASPGTSSPQIPAVVAATFTAAAQAATAVPVVATALPPTPEPLSTVIPEVIQSLPPGEIVLREDSVNRRIADRLRGRGPIEDASMHFVTDELHVDLVILGTTNQIRAGLAISGGRVVVREPVLSGPMALVVSVEDLIAPIEDQVNESLDVTGRNLLAVRVEPGQIVVTIE